MRRIAFDIRSSCILIGFSILFLSLYSRLQAEETGPATSISAKRTTLPTVVIGSTTDSSQSDRMVHQVDVGECACGPCAVFNAFQFGSATLTNLAWSLPGATAAEKVRNLISMYGGKNSSIAHNQPRYLENGGMWDEDIAPFINDWLKDAGAGPRVHGERLVLKRRETPQEQLDNVYRELRHSLADGFPPVVNLQSYAADGNLAHYTWNWLDGHFVTVLAVQDPVPDDGGFSMWVADSQSGRVLKVSVCAGSTPFRAITDKRVRNGKEIDQWTEGYPYLTIRSPKLEGILEGDAARSHPQIICVLQFVVHR
ncbi:MAG TPA: hypothetical protein VNV43_14925 [Candidatus Acidoferrales bacterium]|nr:hypothetical protein [Candidatus Acidoferrales bacterium]